MADSRHLHHGPGLGELAQQRNVGLVIEEVLRIDGHRDQSDPRPSTGLDAVDFSSHRVQRLGWEGLKPPTCNPGAWQALRDVQALGGALGGVINRVRGALSPTPRCCTRSSRRFGHLDWGGPRTIAR